MSFTDRARQALSRLGNLFTESIPDSTQVDADDNQYRRLSLTKRDLNAIEHSRMLELAAFLYQRNGLARRLIEIQRDYVLGEGLTVHSDDPAVDAVVKAFWNFPINDWAGAKGERRFIGLRLFGEACWTVAEMPGSGTLVLGVVDPERISEVIMDPGLIDEPTEVVLKSDASGERRRLKVIRYDPAANGFDDDETGYEGKCFYAAINQLSAMSRGISDLFGLIDYLDASDQLLFAQVERSKLGNAFVWDVTVRGGDDSAIAKEEKRIRAGGVSRPGSINIHGDAITWQAVTPSLAATENDAMAGQLRRWTLGAMGLPGHFFADGDSTNRATAAEMDAPVIKRFTAIQTQWVALLDKVLRYQYQRAAAKGIELKPLKLEDKVPWTIDRSDMSPKDLAKLGAVISQTVAALRECEVAGYVSEDTARAGAIGLLKLIGIDADPQTEAEKIAKQQPRASDYDRTPPDALADAVKGANAKANETATQKGRERADAILTDAEMAEGEGSVTIRLPRPVVNVPPQPAPVVNVPAPIVNVPAPIVNVEAPKPKPRRIRKTIVATDADGVPTEMVEQEE